jgi:hypothetical protein
VLIGLVKMNRDSDGVEILGSLEFSGRLDAWTECLCLKRLPDGGIELSSRRFVLLRYEGEWFGEPVVWPEGHDPDADDADQDVLPISVGGTLVRGRDGCGIVGNELLDPFHDAVATFGQGEFEEALSWLEDYGWTKAPNFEAMAKKIKDALS